MIDMGTQSRNSGSQNWVKKPRATFTVYLVIHWNLEPKDDKHLGWWGPSGSAKLPKAGVGMVSIMDGRAEVLIRTSWSIESLVLASCPWCP